MEDKMIEVSNGYNTNYLDNKDKELCRVTSIELREIEEIAGIGIERLTSAQIKSYVSFINVD
jgi:hypothetical protein